MKAKIEITLDVPDDMRPVGPWSVEQAVQDYVRHWLEEGYYTSGHVELPDGIEYEGFKMEFEK